MFNVFFLLLFQTNPHHSEANPLLLNVINLTAVCIRRLIKMAKKIGAFKNMCQEDQVALLKGGCTEIMLLRSAMHYDAKQHIWQVNIIRYNKRILTIVKSINL